MCFITTQLLALLRDVYDSVTSPGVTLQSVTQSELLCIHYMVLSMS